MSRRKRGDRIAGYEVEEGPLESDVLPFSQVETLDQVRERKFGEARTRVSLQQLQTDLEPVIKCSEAYVSIVWGKGIREMLDANLSARDRHAILHDLSRKLIRELHDTTESLIQLRAEHEEARTRALKRTS